ncbi:hypothetical protein E2C01_099772 [Portunus trituberculatus]|uniref:Uncharacterized protein n=1 Tax=Portunus trituberculatus TaxID=210409 RepID=A0A5B7K167_PORTR|nr:hypothetical protein [Portunus trituberculatus]
MKDGGSILIRSLYLHLAATSLTPAPRALESRAMQHSRPRATGDDVVQRLSGSPAHAMLATGCGTLAYIA